MRSEVTPTVLNFFVFDFDFGVISVSIFDLTAFTFYLQFSILV